MGFIDDVISFLSGRGTPADSKKTVRPSSAPARKEQTRPASRERVQAASIPALQGGGGAGGGMVGMSRGATATPAPEPESNPWTSFINKSTKEVPQPLDAPSINPVKKDSKPNFNFFDDLGAWLTAPSNEAIVPGIGGAAQRKYDREQKHNEVMGEGNLTPDGGIKIPTNEQLVELGRDKDVINVDGDLHPLGGPFNFVDNLQLRQEAQVADTINGREAFSNSLGSATGQRQVRQLTTEEWNALSPEQQKGIIANYALYEAALADKTAEGTPDEAYNADVQAIFGRGGGSDTYMPNTIRVLKDLGYNTETGDLDNFRTFRAIADHRDILGGQQVYGTEARQQVFNELANAPAFTDESVLQSLEAGASLLDSLRNSGSFAPSVYEFGGLATPASELPGEDRDYLLNVLKGLAYRPYMSRLQEDPDFNAEVTATLEDARAQYGDDVISAFFMDNIAQFGNDVDFMTADEFKSTWIGG